MPLIVDAHEDLAWNALSFGRDYTRSAHRTRELESASDTPAQVGQSMLGVEDYLQAQVAVIFGTLYACPRRHRKSNWDTLVYADAREAHRLYAAQLDYYRRLTDTEKPFTLIGSRGDLRGVVDSWQSAPGAPAAADGDERRIGLVPLMEGADAIVEPQEAAWWMEQGLRIVGLAWAQTQYAGGTTEPGPLTSLGRRLLSVMADVGLMLDLAHASDDAYLEALDRFEGTVIVSHANPRALLRNYAHPERLLSDVMIVRLAEHDGVIGIMPQNDFLKPGWHRGDRRDEVTLDRVVDVIDHVCQVTGSAAHVGLGTDFDGGRGLDYMPSELDTIADLPKLGGSLRARGYSEDAIAAILGQNWLRILQRGLPG
jgi:membrane dipeptidase